MAWRVAASSGVRSYWLAMKPTAAGGAKGKSLPYSTWVGSAISNRLGSVAGVEESATS
jgi:hypothetical protein